MLNHKIRRGRSPQQHVCGERLEANFGVPKHVFASPSRACPSFCYTTRSENTAVSFHRSHDVNGDDICPLHSHAFGQNETDAHAYVLAHPSYTQCDTSGNHLEELVCVGNDESCRYFARAVWRYDDSINHTSVADPGHHAGKKKKKDCTLPANICFIASVIVTGRALQCSTLAVFMLLV